MKAIRTVPAAAFAAIAPFEVIGSREYHQSILSEVVIFIGKAKACGSFRDMFGNWVQLGAKAGF